MSSAISILGFAGCLREDSSNKALLRLAQEFLPSNVVLEIVELSALPAYTPGASVPESVSELQAKIQASDALFIATPEYKGLLPNALKQTFTWLLQTSNGTALSEKPVALIGVGRQDATMQPLQAIKSLLQACQASLISTSVSYLSAQTLGSDEAHQAVSTTLNELVKAAEKAKAVLIA